MTGPLCKVCGLPVPKQMTHHSFGATEHEMRREHSDFWRVYQERPIDRAAAQLLVGNRPIARVNNYAGEYIANATTWDGESYVWGGHFHNQTCAAQFGLSMAALFPAHAMPAYRQALAAKETTQ